MKHSACVIVAALALTGSAVAHDFWLEPSTFRPKAGDKVSIHLHVGDKFASEGEKALDKKGTPAFLAWLAGKKVDLLRDAAVGKKPVATLTAPKAGTCLGALERSPRLIRLEGKKFDEYLRSEHLEGPLKEREKKGEKGKPARERYQRGIKLLFRVGDKGDDGWKRVVGHKLEIVPLQDPTGLKAGDKLKARVLFDGKPLANRYVTAYSRSGGKVRVEVERLDGKGEASVKLTGGPMLLRLVHMWRGDGKESDWESAWAALSFAVPEK
jgi:uncharacterized GH25 family protein